MSWDFKPGDRVVCIDDIDSVKRQRIFGFTIREARFASGAVKIGEVYTIKLAAMGRLSGTDKWVPGIQLVEVPGDFMASKFRPVRTTSIASLEAHLHTLPVRTKTDGLTDDARSRAQHPQVVVPGVGPGRAHRWRSHPLRQPYRRFGTGVNEIRSCPPQERHWLETGDPP